MQKEVSIKIPVKLAISLFLGKIGLKNVITRQPPFSWLERRNSEGRLNCHL